MCYRPRLCSFNIHKIIIQTNVLIREEQNANTIRPVPHTMLTQKQRRFLRGLSHPLHPLVQVGNRGITDALISEAENALLHHELVKMRLPADEREQRQHMADSLIDRTGAEAVQMLGRVLTLYKPDPKSPRIELPGS